MKNIWLTAPFIILAISLASCSGPATTIPTISPTGTNAPTATEMPSATPVPPTSTPTPVPPLSFESSDFPRLTVLIPPEISSGGESRVVPFGDTDTSQGENLPRHLLVELRDYPGPKIKFQGPAIRIFTVAGLESSYAYQVENARKVITGAAPASGIYPALPLISGATQIQIRMKSSAFKNGQGFRYLEYEDIPTLETLNNQNMNYIFQGISADGKHYISVIFPVTMPFLKEAISQAATQAANLTTPVPQELLLLPILQKLQTAKDSEFSPSLSILDEVIISLNLTQP